METHCRFLAMRNPEEYETAKKAWHHKTPPGQKVFDMLLGKKEGQLLTPPERIKLLGQSRKLCSAVDVSGGEGKDWCCIEQHWIGTWNIQFSCSMVSDSLRSHGLQYARLPCPSPTTGAYSNSCPSRWWCHPTISSSLIPFSSHLQSFPASGSFPMSQYFTSAGQSIEVLVSTLVPPMNIQGWFPLGWTGWISLQTKGLSRVFSNTTVQKHQLLQVLSFLYSPTLTFIHDYWKNHSFH